MLVADGTGSVRAINDHWSEMSGQSRMAAIGEGWLTAVEPASRAKLRHEILDARGVPRIHTSDHLVAGPHGERWTRWWISRHEVEGQTLVALAVVDVHEDYARQATLYHQATHDALTGLSNRSHLIEATDQALRRQQRSTRRVGLVYVDLDGFKSINDDGGHALGDRVLFAIAARLRNAVRAADMVARIGGDEFAVLCEDLDEPEQAAVVAGRVASSLTEAIELDGRRWTIAASVGYAVDDGGGGSAEALVDRADRAMYAAKRERRLVADSDAFPTVGYGPGSFGAEGHGGPPPGVPSPGPASPGATGTFGAGPAAFGPAASEAPTTSRGVPTEAVPGTEQHGTGAWTAGRATVETPVRREPEGAGRLVTDVVALRDSLESIRRMLDRLLVSEDGVIDIREQRR